MAVKYIINYASSSII